MRRFRILGCMALLLTACSGTSTNTAAKCEQRFWNGTIGTCLPAGWKVLSQEDLRLLGVPDETVTAFQTEQARGGQFDVVTVTAEALPQDMATPDYSQANILAVSTLPDYALIDKIVSYVDGAETAIHVFSARPSTDSPIRRYYQVGASSGRTGYVFTGSFPLSVTDQQANEVRVILQNATFKDVAAAAKE